MKYALIINGKVDAVVEQDSTPTLPGTWVELTGSFGPGDSYAAGVFTKVTPVVKRWISVGAFFDRFGEDKYPILASTNASVQALIKDCSVRSYIDLDNPQLPSGLALLVSAGFSIDPEAVVSDPILDSEKP